MNSKCTEELRVPCGACSNKGPNDYLCQRERGHDGEHRAITREIDNDSDDVIRWGNDLDPPSWLPMREPPPPRAPDLCPDEHRDHEPACACRACQWTKGRGVE